MEFVLYANEMTNDEDNLRIHTYNSPLIKWNAIDLKSN